MIEGTLTRVKGIGHNDSDAAPFKDGWQWQWDHPDLGPLSGYAETKDEARGALETSIGGYTPEPPTITEEQP